MSSTEAELFGSVDFFTDETVTIGDPYPFYEFLRSKGPVAFEPHHGVAVVTGHAESLEVYRNHEVFSACNASTGPFYGYTPPAGVDDVTDDVEQYRATTPLQFMGFMDPPRHQRYRDIVKRLFTPKRLRQNEAFMWGLADRQLDGFVDAGRCEFIHDYAQPFTVMVIADLLGVPDRDREELRQILLTAPPTGAIGEISDTNAKSSTALVMPEDLFVTYIEERRQHPRDDVLTEIALAKFADGETPDAREIAREAGFMFVAGGETTTRLLGFLLRHLAVHPDFQEHVRRDRSLIPNFVEEMLRMEAPVKAHFRLARRKTTLGGVEIPAGTTVMLLIAAANRDPRRFDDPQAFRYDRPNAQEHVTFSRNAHSCLGMSLARAESRVSIERVLDRMSDIRISEHDHAAGDGYNYEYDPTFIFRGLRELHLVFGKG